MAIKQVTTKQVVLTGLTPIMFDRFSGDIKTGLTPEQKLYTQGTTLVFPSLNIISSLSAVNTESFTKRVLPPKEYKAVAAAMLSCISIDQIDIPFLKNGKPIEVGKFQGDQDMKSGIQVVRHVARLPKGIPNPKARPVLPLAWELRFELTIYPSEVLNEQLIEKIFTQGGIQLGLGTYRGVYGKFKFSWS